MKAVTVLFLAAALMFPLLPPGNAGNGEINYTHTVLVEVFTAQYCGPCHDWNENISGTYQSGAYDFLYADMIVRDHSGNVLNWNAYHRMVNECGITTFPASVLDGDYQRILGNHPDQLTGALDACGNRVVRDLDANISVTWLGNASILVSISIQNNEATPYEGRIRAYIVEVRSRYDTAYGDSYHFGFLDYAFNQNISIDAGSAYFNATIWNGNDHADAHGDDFGDVTPDNIRVILGVFNDATGYVDETVAAFPSTESNPPEISDVQATPSVQVLEGYVNITATVTDDSGVGAVHAVITTPDRGTVNQSMTNIAGTDTYYYNTTYDTAGNYTFFIWARDVNANTNVSAPHTFTILLQQNFSLFTGWNLLSIPVEHEYNASTLASLVPGCQMIAWWNAATASYTTFIVNVTPPGSPWDFTIHDGVGYYVKVASNTTLTVSGMPLSTVNVTLYPGWNTIGWWKDTATTASSLAGNITTCTMLAAYDAHTGSYTVFLVGITPPGSPYDFTVEQGMGLFAKVTSGSVWHGEG